MIGKIPTLTQKLSIPILHFKFPKFLIYIYITQYGSTVYIGIVCVYNAHAHFPQENGGPHICVQRSSAGSLQRSGFRENPTYFLTSIRCPLST